MKFILQIILLLLGLYHPLLGSILIILDAHFHFTASLSELKKEGPDWIIMRTVFKKPGLSEFIHKVMGVFLALYSMYYLYSKCPGPGLKLTRYDAILNTFYEKYFYRFVLIIITLAILTKNIIMKKSKGKVAFL